MVFEVLRFHRGMWEGGEGGRESIGGLGLGRWRWLVEVEEDSGVDEVGGGLIGIWSWWKDQVGWVWGLCGLGEESMSWERGDTV